MISWYDSKRHPTENPDEAVLDTPYRPCILQQSDAPHGDDNDRPSGTCTLFTEDENPRDNSVMMDNKLHLKEPSCSFQDREYVEKIMEFQFYVDMVKEMARPGCSAETLNVALSSLSSLVETLSGMSSKQHIYASL